MFSLISAWKNDWANNRDAGDFRRRQALYGATVILQKILKSSISYETFPLELLCAIMLAPFCGRLLDSSWLSDAIWRQRSGSTLAQVMPQPPNTKIRLKITNLKFHSNFPRGQWVNEMVAGGYCVFPHGILDLQPVSAVMNKSSNGHRNSTSKQLFWNRGTKLESYRWRSNPINLTPYSIDVYICQYSKVALK